MAKEKYEISLWEDELVTENAITYYKERKIAIIGSDTMTATCRAFEPQLVENINGTNKFTFKMLYTCRDDTYEDLVSQFCVQPNGAPFESSINGSTSGGVMFLLRSVKFVNNTYTNPFLSLLVNERKVKVFWKDKWYDLIIKNCQEDSDKKTITYTCSDIYINELSKTGFDIELDKELENNTGTITELASTVLEGTDWQVDKDGSDLIQQTREEAVYEVKTRIDIEAENEGKFVYTEVPTTQSLHPYHNAGLEYYYKNNSGVYVHFEGDSFVQGTTYYTRAYEQVTIPRGSVILVYYSPVHDLLNKVENMDINYRLQFAYSNNYRIAQESDFNTSQSTVTGYAFKNEISYFELSNDTYILTEDRDPISGKTYYLQYYECAKGGQVVTNAICCARDGVMWRKSDLTIEFFYTTNLNSLMFPTIDAESGPSATYRAERFVRSQRTIFDPLTNKYCEIYKGTGDFNGLISEGDTIYKYKEIQYRDPTTVNNLVVNGKDFTSVEGWIGNDLTFKLYPAYHYDPNNPSSFINPRSYLQLVGGTEGQHIYNLGLRQLSNYIPNGFALDEKYIFRTKAMTNSTNDDINSPSGTYEVNPARIVPLVGRPYLNSNNETVYENYFYFLDDLPKLIYDDNHNFTGWIEWTGRCIKSASRADIYSDNIGLYLQIPQDVRTWLEQAEFFPLVQEPPESEGGTPGPRINPGDMNISSIAAMYYCYYNHTKNQNITNLDELTYLWNSTKDIASGDTIYSCLRPVYNDDFEMIRTISIKRSNRYNILQKLAETFECFIEFDIQHDYNSLSQTSNGKILYVDGVPQKKIRFKKENGQKTGIGFIYGIDLKTIQRTIQSDQIVTKTIVTPNKNEFAKDGFCTIARSRENPSHMNFILNFDYYVMGNLIDEESLRNNLNRYYYMLGIATQWYERAVYTESSLSTVLLKQRSYLTLYESAITSCQEQIQELQNVLMQILGLDSWVAVQTYISSADYNPHSDEIDSRVAAVCSLEHSLGDYQSSYNGLVASVNALQTQITEAQATQQSTLASIENTHEWFYKLYYRFIQEGSWIDDSYTDDDLYYLEALKNSRTSSRPQVSYTIFVLRLSSLEEFKSKVFHLGDITYIQDTEFFGYIDVNGVKTPYKETVLLSEITSNFDEPEKDTFKVQNYKTEFEDLFQRMNSTSQSFHYSAGGYDRINSTIESNGRINSKVLQDSINSSHLSYATSNEKITQDATGFVISDVVDANRKTKITSGGIFITDNGGETWKNAVNANGVQPQSIAPGLIDIAKVGIIDNKNNIRWDSNGITTYIDASSSSARVDFGRYTRIGKGGLEMRGAVGMAGITYASDSTNIVEANFNRLTIRDITTTSSSSLLEEANELRMDNDTIMHYYYNGSDCDLGGSISFGTQSGIILKPALKGTTRLKLDSDEISLYGARAINLDGGVINFSALDSSNNPFSIIFDLIGGKMVYNWTDASSSTHSNVIDLKTLRS